MSSQSSKTGGNVSLTSTIIGVALTGMSTAGLPETETDNAPSIGRMLAANDADGSAAFIDRLWHALQQR